MQERTWKYVLLGEAQRQDAAVSVERPEREREPERRPVWREALARLADVWPRVVG